MSKKLDLSKTVYELTKEYPELIGIMAELGFTEITKKDAPFGWEDHDHSQRREDEEYFHDGCCDNADE